MNNISENFSGPQGMGKKDAKRYIFAKLYKKDWQRVFIYESQIQIQSPDLAGVTLKIVLARGDNIERLEDLKTKTSYDAFQLSLVVKNEESSWRVSSAKHKRIQANEVF